MMPWNSSVAETSLLKGLSACQPNDFLTAFFSIPRNLRNMYAHSYQSLVWNEMVTTRLATLGMQAVEGDLVIKEDAAQADASMVDESVVEGEPGAAPEALTEEEMFKKRRDIVPHLVTAEEATEGTYSIHDVVLPLPGTEVLFPSHQIGSLFKARLEEDGVLDHVLNGHKIKEFSLTGGYRSLVVLPGEMECELLRYTEVNQDLTRTDLEVMGGKPPHHAMQQEGPLKAVRLSFTLPSSTYATMCLRELMKTSTSASFHHKKVEVQEKKQADAKLLEDKTGEKRKRDEDGESAAAPAEEMDLEETA